MRTTEGWESARPSGSGFRYHPASMSASPDPPAESSGPALDSDAPVLPRRFADYVLEEEIARGAMGVVYRARQVGLERTVALKMILAGRLASERDVKRFLAEAQAASRLQHRRIVPVHEVGVREGRHYFSMDYIEGRSLAELVSAGPVEPSDAARITSQVAEALQYAHEQGVVHRDVKPSNVLLGADGMPWVTDFGLAKALGEESGMTATGEAVGTPNYMSPEQAEGEGEVGAASDVYGLGAVLYALLSGRPPFLSPTVLGTLRMVREREPIPLRVLEPAVPKDLETIVHKCLQKAPERRYASASELALDLERWIGGQPIVARPVGRLERAALWARRHPTVAALTAALILSALVGATAVTWQWRKAVDALAVKEEAQRQRTGAQLDALDKARPEEFSVIVRQLQPLSPEVAALLRATARDPGTRGLRARLALLPIAPEMLQGVADRLLDPDLERSELALAIRLLRAARGVLPPEAWRALVSELERGLEGPASEGDRRFPAAVALTALDPVSSAETGRSRALAEGLASENPILLAVLREVLDPMPRPVLESLGTIFLEEPPGERQQAAVILAECGVGHPDLLSRLLTRADDLQYSSLLILLEAVRETGAEEWIAGMREELASEVEPAPEVLGERPWPDPGEDVRAAVEDAGGFMTDRLALCQEVAWEAVLPLCEELRPHGFRPVRVRPYETAAGLRAAVLWQRDGRRWAMDWEWLHGELAEINRSRRSEGLIPADLAGYAPGDEERLGNRYVSLWSSPPPGVLDSVMLVRLTDSELADALENMDRSLYSPDAYQVFESISGRTLHNQVWLRYSTQPDHLMRSRIPAADYGPELFPRYCQTEVQVPLAPSPVLSGIWCTLERRSRTLLEDGLEEHLEACRALAAGGWQPAAISVAGSRDGPVGPVASVWHRPPVSAQAESDSCRRQARAVETLVHLGREAELWPRLAHSADPGLRSQLIVGLSRAGVRPELLADRLVGEGEPSIRRALILSLGGWGAEEVEDGLRGRLLGRATELFGMDPDPGVHSAAEWLLRRWGGEAAVESAEVELDLRPEHASWTVDGQGHTLVEIPGPVEFPMGSPGWEEGRELTEEPHRRRIERSFAISIREVSSAQFQVFLDEHRERELERDLRPDQPAWCDWYDAAAYCRWLSEQEGLPEEEMCYPPLEESDQGLVLPPDWLDRTGYRLPTEAEWEYACRAGAETAYCFGSDVALLPHFARCRANSPDFSSGAVGALLPNDLGLFDMHGNAMEWTHDRYGPYPIRVGSEAVVDAPSPDPALGSVQRIIRGGSYDAVPGKLRSADRTRALPATTSRQLGFRVARTLR